MILERNIGPIGFGCSALMGGITRRHSLRLLETAYAHGVTHFDVARSYGYGEAEGVVGRFLRGRRESVTVTTKVGLMVSRSNVARRWVQAAVRWGARAAPVLKPALRRRATGLVSQPPLTASLIGASVTTSLRELRTDYIDVLLLHEATAEQLTEPVHDALRSLRQRGLIRAFGVGSDLSKLPAWIERPPDDFGVFQLENNPVVRSLDRFDLSGAKWVVTHRAIGQVYQGIHQRLLEDQKLLARWNRVLDLDVGAPGALARLFLEYARVRNSSGTVLFSSRDEIRIGQNVAVLRGVDTGRLERGQALERLVDELKAGPPW